MPISVYRCDCCKERFERLIPMSANSTTASCPSCGAADARKHMSTFAAPRKGRLTATGQSCAPTGG